VINGTDRLRIAPQFRNLGENYEPEVWRLVMAVLRPGDQVADVGAHIGLYSLALAQRVGPTGQATAFEPDPGNYQHVLRHARLNGLGAQLCVVNAAVGKQDGTISFSGDKDIQNQIVPAGTPGARQVPVVRLDTHFAGRRLDLLKVDVEGFEEEVLAGAEGLLGDAARAPRTIFIEVHPYNWHLCGTTSESLLSRLKRLGCAVEHLDGQPVSRISEYGEVVARIARGVERVHTYESISAIKNLVVPKGRQPRRILTGAFSDLTMSLDLATQTQLYAGTFEREVQGWLRRFSTGADTAIDVGMAEGEYGLFFLRKTGVRRVLDFEPLDACRAALENNLQLNGLAGDARLRLSPALVGERPAPGMETLDMLLLEVGRTTVVKVDPAVRWIIETHTPDLERACVAHLEAAGYAVRIVPNAWWRIILPEMRGAAHRPEKHNRWLVAARPGDLAL